MTETSILAKALAHQGPVAFLAPFGSGRSQWCRQLVSAGRPAEFVLYGDAVKDESALIERINDEPGQPWVIATTHLPFGRLSIPPSSWLVFTQDDLWLSGPEIEDRVRTTAVSPTLAPAIAAVILDAGGGWPALVDRVVRALDADPESARSIERLVRRGPHIDSLRQSILDQLPEPERDTVRLASRLSRLSPSILDAIWGGDGPARMRQCGLPLVLQPDDSLTLFPALHHLGDPGPLPLPPSLAPALIASFGLVRAVRELCAIGHAPTAVELLASADEHEFEAEDREELIRAIRDVLDLVEPSIALLLRLARLYEVTERFGAARQALDRAHRLAEQAGDDYQLLRAQLLDAAIIGSTALQSLSDEAFAELEARQRAVGDESTALELREVGVYRLFHSHLVADISRSVPLARRLAEDFALDNRPASAGRILRRLAAGPCFGLGRFQLASDLIERSVQLGREPGGTPVLARRLLQLMIAAETMNRVSFGQLEPLVSVDLRVEPSPVLNCYFWMAKLTDAALSDDPVAALHYHARSIEHLGELAGTTTDIYVRAKAVVALAVVGCTVEAKAELDGIVDSIDRNPLEVSLARLTYEARHGSPARARRLAEDPQLAVVVPRERRWQVDLELLIARHRQGHSVPASALDGVLAAAAEHGLRNRALSAIPAVMFGSDSPAWLSGQAGLWIRIFGECSIRTQDAWVPHNEGLPVLFIKLLCARGPVVSVDTAIDLLWPDADQDTGRRRLKNVVRRARMVLGPDAIQRTQDFISLAPFVRVDLHEFHRLATEANASTVTAERAIAAAVEALELVKGRLLPNEVFVDWTDEIRWHAEAVARGLLEQLADSDGAVRAQWLLDTATRIGCVEEETYVRVARYAAAESAVETARVALDRARAIALELGGGFQVPNDLAALDRTRH